MDFSDICFSEMKHTQSLITQYLNKRCKFMSSEEAEEERYVQAISFSFGNSFEKSVYLSQVSTVRLDLMTVI